MKVDSDLCTLSFPAKQLKMTTEVTFIMVKPDGVQRNLTGEIIRRFEAKGYYLRYTLPF